MSARTPAPRRTVAVTPAARAALVARLGAALAVVALTVTACGATSTPQPIAPTPPPASGSAASPTSPASGSPSPSVPGSPTAPSASPSPSPVSSPSPTPLAVGDPTKVAVRLEPLVDGLESPLFVTGAGDGSGRLFVIEQPGRIRIVRDGRLLSRPFLDISGRLSCCGERGLLGLAFQPDDPTRFFVDYTDRNGDTVVARFEVGSDPDRADPGSERVVLRVRQPYPNHNGGMLAFGPDGDLYIGMGDGGSAGDPQGNGQRLDTRLGKLLRIDVRGSGSKPYTIPDGNPYAGVAGAEPEIWSVGLRNPWRFSFDRATGDLWIGDVGQNRWEEVDRSRAADGGGRGANFGWSRMEGTHCYPSGKPCSIRGLQKPIAEYGHDQGCAVTGGYVYRGSAAPVLAGVYLFGDYCSGRIWGLASGGADRQSGVVLAETGRSISSFGQDDAGELYVTDIAKGAVLRVVATAR